VKSRPDLGDATWRDVADARPLIVVPVGSCEQHGPHLPLDTDTRIARALAMAFARADDDVMVTPAIAIGASGEHASFPGTLSIGNEVLESVIVEMVRSAEWARGVVLVNGHGGNATAVHRAVRRLTDEGRRVLAWWPTIDNGDAHAGMTETSLMLAIDPDAVRLDRTEPGCMTPLADVIDVLREQGVRVVSPNGVLGDPTNATTEHGEALLAMLVADLSASVDEWCRRAGR
jgi:mycofactocin precursor peptide peptidase